MSKHQPSYIRLAAQHVMTAPVASTEGRKVSALVREVSNRTGLPAQVVVNRIQELARCE